jgi:hypothetical protein
LIGGEPVKALLDVYFPIMAAVESLLVKPGQVAAGSEVAVEPFCQRGVLVMP